MLSRLWIRCADHKKPRPTKRGHPPLERPQVSRGETAGRPELQGTHPTLPDSILRKLPSKLRASRARRVGHSKRQLQKEKADPSPAPQRARLSCYAPALLALERRLVGNPAFATLLMMTAPFHENLREKAPGPLAEHARAPWATKNREREETQKQGAGTERRCGALGVSAYR